MAREGALWMGDLADYMDEEFIVAAFHSLGEESVQNVKVMKNRYTGHPAGYCFVNFTTDNNALTAMHKLNGKIIPNSQPPVRFKLNHSSTRGSNSEKEFSLWVGDLTPDVDDFALYKTFGSRYNSIKTAKVIYDPSGASKGFAFVRFYSEDEYRDALTHMNNYKGLGQKPLKVSYAVPKKQQQQFSGTPGTEGATPTTGANTSGYSNDQQQQQYYEQYWNNYAAWQDPSTGGYSQGPGGPAPDGSQQYYDPYQSAQHSGYAEYDQSAQDANADPKPNKEDFEPVEWNVPLDIDQINRDYIEQSEALWTKLEKERWSFYENSDLMCV